MNILLFKDDEFEIWVDYVVRIRGEEEQPSDISQIIDHFVMSPPSPPPSPKAREEQQP